MKLVVAALKPTPILWWRASGLASPTEVPASTLPALWMAPVRANMASRSVVLPLWKGPTSAMHRGPRGLLTSCPIAASLFGARPMIGSADQMLRPSRRFGKQENRRCAAGVGNRQTAGGSIMIRNAAAKPAISMRVVPGQLQGDALQNGHHDARRRLGIEMTRPPPLTLRRADHRRQYLDRLADACQGLPLQSRIGQALCP